MIIGYARVSTSEQNLFLQRDALDRAGCERVFEEQMSGGRFDRPILARALDQLRRDDMFVVWKLDRLGRSLRALLELVESFERRQIEFRSLTEGIDTSTTAGRFFFHVMAALTQMERDLIRDRTKAGLAAARARGRKGGRKPKLKPYQLKAVLRDMADPATNVAELAEQYGVDRSTLYRWHREELARGHPAE